MFLHLHVLMEIRLVCEYCFVFFALVFCPHFYNIFRSEHGALIPRNEAEMQQCNSIMLVKTGQLIRHCIRAGYARIEGNLQY